MSRHLKSNFV